MNLLERIGFGASVSAEFQLIALFPLSIDSADFVTVDTRNVYSKILTDVIERTQGIPDEVQPSLWDNCLKSEASLGLISLLSKAMADKKNLFLVYDKAIKVLREATQEERQKIEQDYKKSGKSSTGVFISFENYQRTDMIKIYSALEYCTVAALNKQMNLSKAAQLKMNELRSSVGASDSEIAKAQAKNISESLAKGLDVYMDGKDIIETLKPDLTAVQEAMKFLNEKRAFYLGLPDSYITGELAAGLSDSGMGDAKAIDRGLRAYYFSIVKPAVEAVFNIKTTYKPQDFSQVTAGLEVLKTFALTDGEFLSAENKLKIVNKIFDLPENTKGDAPEKPVQGAVTKPGEQVVPPKV